ncbi:hypothetical protein [Nocardia cyriacigeorgica]|jgi:hypothetical protein|uniref:hypothetical protein n=1 Tax=Nocardia cyriacigeorgica TaxID=135487 RepID=UPI0013D1A312|nr:hypothetical protein [Nocardia cyriacigeorgica]MBF6452479.1 hypothetical protein [Nocardia cyriacigeorgica]MBF6476668.1 hypothetical protein [Nocardia cyriacigeorgica]MBF6549648.1 hypothetical protein [Nocardia cyriacigeorgica]NEW26275.1 hypothetical protein [Nocardia cyriacigeorgica]
MRFARASLGAGALAITAVAAIFTAPPAQAAPPGHVTCGATPVGSRLDVTCTNTDVGAGTGTLVGLCSNLRILYEAHFRLAGNSSGTFSQDCGPGAQPIWWHTPGITDYQQMLQNRGT